MQRLSFPALVAAALLLSGLGSGCKRPASRVDRLAAAVHQHLALREGKLSRFRCAVRVDEKDKPLTSYDFTFRAPQRMRGRLYRPRMETLSFDGTSVYQVIPEQKLFRTLALPASPEARALRIEARFSPFVPEGFRAPMLPWASVHASVVSHPRAPSAVALSATQESPTGKPITLTYTVRWPSGDFLVRREEGPDGISETRVDDETCDEKAGFCTPLRLSTWKNSVKLSTMEILEMELNESPEADEFTLTPPAGYASEKGQL